LLGIPKEDVIAVSAKTGMNVDKVLDAVLERIDDPIAFQQKNPKKFRIQEEVKE